MRFPASRPLFASLLLSAAAFAQGAVSPSAFGGAEGNSGQSYAFGGPGADGYLAVHDDLLGRPQTIRSLSLRLDGQRALPAGEIHFKAHVYMSTAATTSATISRDFARNHGADVQQVGRNVEVTLRQPTNTLPRRFELTIPLTTPFVFQGKGPLCWELRMVEQLGVQGFGLDWISGSSTTGQSYWINDGAGCRAFGAGLPAHASVLQRTDASGRLTRIEVFGANFPPFDFAVMFLSDSATFSGLPLPSPIPGTATGPSGLCTLYVGPLVTVPLTTSNIGLVQVPIDMPAVLPNGASLFAQHLGRDQHANAAQLIASDMVQVNLVAPWSTVTVSSVVHDTVANRFTMHRNAGYVVRFD